MWHEWLWGTLGWTGTGQALKDPLSPDEWVRVGTKHPGQMKHPVFRCLGKRGGQREGEREREAAGFTGTSSELRCRPGQQVRCETPFPHEQLEASVAIFAGNTKRVAAEIGEWVCCA